MVQKSKRYRAAAAKIDHNKKYDLGEAVKLLKECGGTKFDQTVNIAIKLGIDPKQSDQTIRGAVSLPKGTGKTLRVVAFCQGPDIEAAKAAGAIAAGVDDLVEKVQGGWLDFDVAIATPDVMPKVGRLGRVLGPKGLMPSPKGGTVSKDIVTATREFSGGKIEFRNDADGNVHAPVGKLSFAEKDLEENITAFLGHVRSMRPAAAKGVFLEKAVVSSTMGPGIMLSIEADVRAATH